MKARILDLFCGAGGAARGYQRAGFYVVGVDKEPMPNYCGDEFHQADALTFPLDGFDAIHASPPCQFFSAARRLPKGKADHADLLTPTRAKLAATGIPYVIENVPGAPMPLAVVVCGASLSLGTRGYKLRRHRLFEASFPLLVPPCACVPGTPTIGIYGEKVRDRRRDPDAPHPDRGRDFSRSVKVVIASEALGIDWMTWPGLTQAIPPAYTELIGLQLLDHLRAERAA